MGSVWGLCRQASALRWRGMSQEPERGRGHAWAVASRRLSPRGEGDVDRPLRDVRGQDRPPLTEERHGSAEVDAAALGELVERISVGLRPDPGDDQRLDEQACGPARPVVWEGAV
jgi:hypothetical protein